eukprot:CAMPEP_0114557044 /NCGR_PEP_ID=MMETSP0114-20121206/9614_1 /TAXON_ID=31324 /ORGANISM="Goniomonas sp, Strain m" /LENGTH=477 /DNA_ID=CAMNT_0001742293 /DNA_START=51 /DNA_END=1484 /DNA_ORIENTATION=-
MDPPRRSRAVSLADSIFTEAGMHSNQKPVFKPSTGRGLLLLLFGAIQALTGFMFTGLTGLLQPISSLYESQFASPEDAELLCKCLTGVFIVAYLPMSGIAAWALQVRGLRSIMFSLFGTFVGSCLKCIGSISVLGFPPQFIYVALGDIACALGQPFIRVSVTHFSCAWFGVRERALATAFSTCCFGLGAGGGLLLGVIFVPNDSPNPVLALRIFLAIQGAAAAGTLILSCLLMRSNPAQPATKASLRIKDEGRALKRLRASCWGLSWRLPWREVVPLALGVGLSSGSLVPVLCEAYLYLDDSMMPQVAFLQSLVLAGGAIIALGVTLLIHHSRASRSGLVALSAVGFALSLTVTQVLPSSTYGLKLFAPCLLGLGVASNAVVGLALEAAAEVSWPYHPATSAAVIMTSTGVCAILQYFVVWFAPNHAYELAAAVHAVAGVLFALVPSRRKRETEDLVGVSLCAQPSAGPVHATFGAA